jgi:hypothetical protein
VFERCLHWGHFPAFRRWLPAQCTSRLVHSATLSDNTPLSYLTPVKPISHSSYAWDWAAEDLLVHSWLYLWPAWYYLDQVPDFLSRTFQSRWRIKTNQRGWCLYSDKMSSLCLLENLARPFDLSDDKFFSSNESLLISYSFIFYLLVYLADIHCIFKFTMHIFIVPAKIKSLLQKYCYASQLTLLYSLYQTK